MSRRLVPCLLTAIWLLVPSFAPAERLELPNIIALPADDLTIDAPDESYEGQRALRFTTITANIGDYPLEILTGKPRDRERFAARQCVRWVSRICRARRSIGYLFFETHPDHFHFHYEDYATYQLRRLAGGSIDETPEGLVAGGVKRAFCMQDSDVYDDDSVLRYVQKPPFYKTCDGVWQGVSPGWQDEYDSTLAGQQIVIDSVPDGDYALVITIDPLARMFETTRVDNRSVRLVRIYDQGTQVMPID